MERSSGGLKLDFDLLSSAFPGATYCSSITSVIEVIRDTMRRALRYTCSLTFEKILTPARRFLIGSDCFRSTPGEGNKLKRWTAVSHNAESARESPGCVRLNMRLKIYYMEECLTMQ